MELPIFDSILHGGLRPWLIDTTDHRKFNAWVKAASTSPATYGELQRQLSALLNDFPDLMKKVNKQPPLKVNLQALFYQCALSGYTDPITNFYWLAIASETLRVSNLLSQQVADLIEGVDKRYTVKKALNSVKTLATQTADELNERGFASFPDARSELTHFVLFTQKQMLTALFFEIQERFEDLVPPGESEHTFCTNVLHEQPPTTPLLNKTAALFEFKIQRIISENKFSEATALLTQIPQDAKFANLQAALENLIFLHAQNHDLTSLTLDQLTNHDFVGNCVSLAKQASNAQWQSLQYGHERREVVIALLDKLDYLNSTTLNKLSIPQLLHRWLSEQKEIFTTRVTEKFPVTDSEPSPKNGKKGKTKLTFGFRGNTAKLKSVLSDLCNKVDLLKVEKNKSDELFALLTLKDVKPNSTKIYLDCETTQFRYIIDQLGQYFGNLTPTSIEKSGNFYSKKGKKITAQNLFTNKIDNPKEKETIDKIIQQLQ